MGDEHQEPPFADYRSSDGDHHSLRWEVSFATLPMPSVFAPRRASSQGQSWILSRIASHISNHHPYSDFCHDLIESYLGIPDIPLCLHNRDNSIWSIALYETCFPQWIHYIFDYWRIGLKMMCSSKISSLKNSIFYDILLNLDLIYFIHTMK